MRRIFSIGSFGTLLVIAGLLAAAPQAATAADAVPTAAPSGSPIACAKPNVPASVVTAATPEMSIEATRRGVEGTVGVAVLLDETGKATDSKILSSPNRLLNATSVAAARNSRFSPEIRDCRPVGSIYEFYVTYTSH